MKNDVNAKSTLLDFEVECVDATGIEEIFDEGMTYIAEPHTDSSMLYVYDRNGQKRECFRERFKRVQTVPKTIKFRKPELGDKMTIIGEPKMYFKYRTTKNRSL